MNRRAWKIAIILASGAFLLWAYVSFFQWGIEKHFRHDIPAGVVHEFSVIAQKYSFKIQPVVPVGVRFHITSGWETRKSFYLMCQPMVEFHSRALMSFPHSDLDPAVPIKTTSRKIYVASFSVGSEWPDVATVSLIIDLKINKEGDSFLSTQPGLFDRLVSNNFLLFLKELRGKKRPEESWFESYERMWAFSETVSSSIHNAFPKEQRDAVGFSNVSIQLFGER